MGKFNNMNLSGFSDTVILITGSLYVKTEVAMQTLIKELKTIGYDVELSKHSKDKWYAKLPDIHQGKCGSCNELISTHNIKSHGHKCEKCGEVTYWEILDGTIVHFSFTDSDNRHDEGMTDIKMTAKYWDYNNGWIYFYPKCEGSNWTNNESAQAYFNANSDKWEEVKKDGEKLIKMRYTQPWDIRRCAINPFEISGPRNGPVKQQNYSIVKVWDGKEYGEWDHNFPLPDSISCYGRWNQPILETFPKIHNIILHTAGQVEDKGWYYQDGRPYFQPGHWQNMSTFIRHFTKLDADAFDKAWPHFRKDGPGGIDDLATWCHPDAVPTNRPNICNAIIGLSKVMSNQPLVKGEEVAMEKAFTDGGTFDKFVDTIANGRRKT